MIPCSGVLRKTPVKATAVPVLCSNVCECSTVGTVSSCKAGQILLLIVSGQVRSCHQMSQSLPSGLDLWVDGPFTFSIF